MSEPISIPAHKRLVRLLSAAYRRLVIGRVPKLFDAPFYERTYGEVSASGLDPYLHFVRYGAARNHDPNVDFDTAFYRAQSGATRLDPVRHYLKLGANAGLDPSPSFSTRTYLTRYPDVAKAGINPLLHYLTDGRREARVAAPSTLEPEGMIFLRGVPESDRSAYPTDKAPRFQVRLARAVPLAACTESVPRICLILSLDATEIQAVIHAFSTFPQSPLESLTIKIDMASRLHPPNPTLALTLESCFRAIPNEQGFVSLRYAEARIWDIAIDRPKVLAGFSAGCLEICEF